MPQKPGPTPDQRKLLNFYADGKPHEDGEARQSLKHLPGFDKVLSCIKGFEWIEVADAPNRFRIAAEGRRALRRRTFTREYPSRKDPDPIQPVVAEV